MAAGAPPRDVYVKHVDDASFAPLARPSGAELVASLAARACAAFPHWRATAARAALHLLPSRDAARAVERGDAAALADALRGGRLFSLDTLDAAGVGAGACVLVSVDAGGGGGSAAAAAAPPPPSASDAAAAVAAAVRTALRDEAARPAVDVHHWERPGAASVKLDDDFAAFLAAVARAVRAPAAALRLYYFRGPAVLANRVRLDGDAALRAFARERAHALAVWAFEPPAGGPPSPEEAPAGGAAADEGAVALDALPPQPLSRSSRLSAMQGAFRAAVLHRDGPSCVLCAAPAGGCGKSALEAAHVVAARTPARVLDALALPNVFDTVNGVTLCADCHHFFDRHMWHAAADGTAVVADALLAHADAATRARWAALHGRALRAPPPPLRDFWPPPRLWEAQARLCREAAAARLTHVADLPFFCDVCGARFAAPRRVAQHECREGRNVYTPLLARVFRAEAEADAADAGRELVFGEDAEEGAGSGAGDDAAARGGGGGGARSGGAGGASGAGVLSGGDE